MQLGQLIGVSIFGTLFLSQVGRFAPHSLAQAQSSAHAIATTIAWMIPLAVVGVMAGTMLARTATQAKRLAPPVREPELPVPTMVEN